MRPQELETLHRVCSGKRPGGCLDDGRRHILNSSAESRKSVDILTTRWCQIHHNEPVDQFIFGL